MPHSLSVSADTTPATARARLTRLQAERHEAAGADPAGGYLGHLDAAIAAARTEYTVAAVTQLAALRAALGDAPQG